MRHFFSILSIFITSLTVAALEMPRSTRIGIVGAGPAGLSLGHFLKQAGFADVTVLEKNQSPGGKTSTFEYAGETWEMGAIMTGPSYTEVNDLAGQFGQKIVKFAPGASEIVQFDAARSELKKMSVLQKLKYLAAALEYEIIYRRYRPYIEAAGLRLAPTELNEPFEKWAQQNFRFAATIQELLAHSFVAFGYGSLREVPALYVLKYFSPSLLSSFITGRIDMFESGYQELWKQVAESLNVKNNFKVTSAQKISDSWEVHSADGRKEVFDILIYTGPLDEAALVLPLPEKLRELFSQIQYQYYSSTLVDMRGLPRGNGVIPQNYNVSAKGGLVSWLHRWPEKSNLANFYTLSDKPVGPERVEQQIRNFALQSGAQFVRNIKSIEWKYFPHFSSQTLAQQPYKFIESLQGAQGLFFAGEVMNFSTVEHSVSYSRALALKYFSGQGDSSTFEPRSYRNLSATDKLDYLWQKVLQSRYSELPSYEDLQGSSLKALLGFFPSALKKAFSNRSDFLEVGRQKIIHKLGSVAQFEFVPVEGEYQKFSGLIRLSNAVDPTGGVVFPSFAMKIPQDEGQASINFTIGKAFDGQRLNDDPKGPADFNFFRNEPYPFSNEIPLQPKSVLGKVFKWVFDWAHYQPNYIPVDEMSQLMNQPAPRRLVFLAPTEIQNLMSSANYVEPRDVFALIPAGTTLFRVYASEGLSDSGRHVGDLVTKTAFVASSFGDFELYFRHEDNGVKKTRPGFFRKWWLSSKNQKPQIFSNSKAPSASRNSKASRATSCAALFGD